MDIQYDDLAGRGLYAEVWRGTDSLGRTVGVKFFHHAESREEQLALQHAKALARVKHPRVVQVLAVEQQEHPETHVPQMCVIMEYAEGTPLSKLETLDSSVVHAIGIDIIQGLIATHTAGVVHGDLHDGNVIIGTGRAVIIDMLYTHSLAEVGTRTAQATRGEDIRNLIRLLHILITKSGADVPGMAELTTLLTTPPSTVEAVLDAWNAAFSTVQSNVHADDHYRKILREVSQRFGFAKWDQRMSGLTMNGQPSIDKDVLTQLEDNVRWLLRRSMPGIRPDIERALLNLRVVTHDLCEVFKTHIEDRHGSTLWTKKIYKNARTHEEDDALTEAFEAHVDLVEDLAYELTRAANWLCDVARGTIDPKFMLDEGRLSMTSGPFMDFSYNESVIQYRAGDIPQQGIPYPGLAAFLEARANRDTHWGQGALPPQLHYTILGPRKGAGL